MMLAKQASMPREPRNQFLGYAQLLPGRDCNVARKVERQAFFGPRPMRSPGQPRRQNVTPVIECSIIKLPRHKANEQPERGFIDRRPALMGDVALRSPF